ncbi:hypothetical protein RZL41_003149 [Pseudomonas aeruginosa]|uniref:hypothetical protein n=1 Tax=Pseudomonas aeruginosa TaxID=287 RepID=UPI00292A8FE3|nr:hypothetical protein [Pseudomonas aeruginosa]HCF6753295.1 hypothetical protein [Pseudomonas aeruginosa]
MSDRYKTDVLETLSSFQSLEFGLKIYIASAYALIKHKTHEEIAFEYSYNDIKSHSLERLASTYKKLTKNQELAKRIHKLIDARNKLAHVGLLVAEEIFADIIDSNLEDESQFIRQIHGTLDSCLDDLSKEIQLILSTLSKYGLPLFSEDDKQKLFR